MADLNNLNAQLEQVAKEFAPRMAAYAEEQRFKTSFAEALEIVLNGVMSEYIIPFREAKTVKEIQQLKSECIRNVLKTMLG